MCGNSCRALRDFSKFELPGSRDPSFVSSRLSQKCSRPLIRPGPVEFRFRWELGGCRRISAVLDDSSLMRPGLTFIQALIMLFHIEHGILLTFGATKIQLTSGVLGPLLWTGSRIWSALYQMSYFQGSPPGASPLISSLARRASDWALGSMIPSPPWVVGSVSVSHLTLARAGASLPPHMKFLITPLICVVIRGLGFQHVTIYHMEARRTQLATKILPARDSWLWLQLMSLLFRAIIILSKFASDGSLPELQGI